MGSRQIRVISANDHGRQSARRRALVRGAVALAILLVSAFGGLRVSASTSDEVAHVSLTPAAPGRPVSFHDRLVAGLQARRKSEVAFIDKVVAAVNTGKLPERLVDQTFFWARARVRSTAQWYGQPRRPIIYFQPALAFEAKHLGIDL